MSILQNADAKMQGKEKKGAIAGTIPAIHRKELIKKKWEHSFPFTISVKIK